MKYVFAVNRGKETKDSERAAFGKYLIRLAITGQKYKCIIFYTENSELRCTHPEKTIIMKSAGNHRMNSEETRFRILREWIGSLKPDDELYVASLGDLGDSPTNTTELYFQIVMQGITLEIEDAGYLNTSLFPIKGRQISSETRELLQNQIKAYYRSAQTTEQENTNRKLAQSLTGKGKKSFRS